MAAEAGEAFWRFSLQVYGRPGVAEACLALQDRHGVDVNLLLFCCWTGGLGQRLSGGQMDQLLEAVGPWHGAVVKPLRSVRRWLKTQALAPAEAAAGLRRAVKARELDAERLEQAILAEQAVLLARDSPAAGPGTPALAAANLAVYMESLAIELAPDDEGCLAGLLRAAFGGLTLAEARSVVGGAAERPGLDPRPLR
jgi:uncharacterized protein (TIGR02444 family)